jgi:23S rRNA pseudouridine1911/1915/1917 synthase
MSADPSDSAEELGSDDDAAESPVGELRQLSVLAVDESGAGQRLDAFLASRMEGVSRARIKRSIDEGLTTVDGVPRKASHRMNVGERIEVVLPPAAEGPQPEATPLDVLFEDAAIVVVNKPAGMVVHPAKGHWAGTLAGALVHRFAQLSGVGGAARPGIVHRLDRDTSGAIVVAKTDEAHHNLAKQFQDRSVSKEYLAIVAGSPDRDADRVDMPIGPHPSHREKMALRSDHADSRPAETFYEVVERFPGFALVRARPKTGRTHQIRLHLAHVRCPVLCDRLYGGRSRLTVGELRAITRRKHLAASAADGELLLERQALHAHRLSFAHPSTGASVSVEAPLPADMSDLLDVLRAVGIA